MTTDTGRRIMIIRAGVTGAAVAQGMIKDRIVPGGCIMTGAALRCKSLAGMVSWSLVAGHAISLWSMIHQDLTPGAGGVTLAAIPEIMNSWFIVGMAGQTRCETGVIHANNLPIRYALMAIRAIIAISR